MENEDQVSEDQAVQQFIEKFREAWRSTVDRYILIFIMATVQPKVVFDQKGDCAYVWGAGVIFRLRWELDNELTVRIFVDKQIYEREESNES